MFLGGKLRQAGEKYAFFIPSDHGVRFVANSVVTSADILKKRPDTVRRFTVALLRGWQASVDPANSQKAIRTLQQFDKDSTLETLQEQLQITRGLIHPDPSAAVGTIDVEAWKQTEQIMLQQKQIPGPVNVDRYLQQVPKY